MLDLVSENEEKSTHLDTTALVRNSITFMIIMTIVAKILPSRDACGYNDCSEIQTASPLIMKGIRQPKRFKFSSESEFFMMTDTTDPSNNPTLVVPSTTIDVVL